MDYSEFGMLEGLESRTLLSAVASHYPAAPANLGPAIHAALEQGHRDLQTSRADRKAFWETLSIAPDRQATGNALKTANQHLDPLADRDQANSLLQSDLDAVKPLHDSDDQALTGMLDHAPAKQAPRTHVDEDRVADQATLKADADPIQLEVDL